MSNNRKIRHFRNFGSGAFTVVSERHDLHDGTSEFVYGVSFCSPKDQFSKKKGVTLASERLSNRNSRFTGKVAARTNRINNHDVNALILSHILLNVDLPRDGHEQVEAELEIQTSPY